MVLVGALEQLKYSIVFANDKIWALLSIFILVMSSEVLHMALIKIVIHTLREWFCISAYIVVKCILNVLTVTRNNL